jgi:hypothetical protein
MPIIQLPKAWSIRLGFSLFKMKDDDQKKFTSLLAIDSAFFHRAFAIPCTM